MKEGDWRRKNIGLLFCKYVAEKVCEEISACDLDDFSCPRREHNKFNVPSVQIFYSSKIVMLSLQEKRINYFHDSKGGINDRRALSQRQLNP